MASSKKTRAPLKEIPVTQPPLLVIVTGMSGAGRSVAIKTLEDLGFYCMENLPLPMMEAAIEYIQKTLRRSSNLRWECSSTIKRPLMLLEIRAKLSKHMKVDVLFLTADEDVLADRYGATRRKHPGLDTGGELLAAIRRERHMLASIEKKADAVFDTSTWPPHYLARTLEERYSSTNPGRKLFVTITSFGFKYG